MHKPFAERLQELIDDEFTFPGNPDAAADGVILAMETQLAEIKTEYEAEKRDRVRPARS